MKRTKEAAKTLWKQTTSIFPSDGIICSKRRGPIRSLRWYLQKILSIEETNGCRYFDLDATNANEAEAIVQNRNLLESLGIKITTLKSPWFIGFWGVSWDSNKLQTNEIKKLLNKSNL